MFQAVVHSILKDYRQTKRFFEKNHEETEKFNFTVFRCHKRPYKRTYVKCSGEVIYSSCKYY